MNKPTIVAFLAFAAVILAVESLYWLVKQLRGSQKAINRRIALSQGQRSQVEVLDILRRERGFADFNSATLTGVSDYLVQTGLRTSRTALALWTLAIAAATALAAATLFGQAWFPILAGLALAPLLVFLYLRVARKRRIARFSMQLPDALDVIVRGLRVGHALPKALDLVAREMPDPIGGECGMTADEMTFGQDVVTAMNNLHRRVGMEDLLFLAIAVSVQSRTGGNLADVIARLARLVRERAMVRLKIAALSAEGRMSAWFLSAMPFVLFAVIQLLSPSYFDAIVGGPLEIPAFVYGLGSLVIANIVIYRMVNFKV